MEGSQFESKPRRTASFGSLPVRQDDKLKAHWETLGLTDFNKTKQADRLFGAWAVEPNQAVFQFPAHATFGHSLFHPRKKKLAFLFCFLVLISMKSCPSAALAQ